MLRKVGLSLLTTATILTGVSSDAIARLQEALDSVKTTEQANSTQDQTDQPEPEPEKSYWVGKNLTPNEATTLKFFQDQGITDRMALAVLMGNIKQESMFVPNICEGGARMNYEQCHRGGYGLIQWTTSFRYWGLGNHAKTIKGNPSTLDTQLSYLLTEREFKEIEYKFRTEKQSLQYYMKAAYYWLGWGIYGNRGHYSQTYYNSMTKI